MKNQQKRSDNRKIVILGYNKKLAGGVTSVTEQIISGVTDVKLIPYLNSYNSIIKEVYGYLKAILKIVLFMRHIKGFHLIVASKGDVYRAYLPIVISNIFKKPVLVHYHTSYGVLNTPGKGCIRFFEKIVFSKLTSIRKCIFLSDGLKKEYSNITDKKDTFFGVIPNALPIDWYAQKIKPREKRSVDIIFVGRWSKEKGIDDLLTFAEIAPHYNFHTYSNGPKSVNLSNVTCHNWANSKTIKHIMSNAKLIVLPSYAEAYPTVLIEALSCGTPFVASDLVGVNDIAKNSGGGRTFLLGDINQFSNQVGNLLGNKKIWEEFSNQGYAWVNDYHNIDSIMNQWDKLYANLSHIK